MGAHQRSPKHRANTLPCASMDGSGSGFPCFGFLSGSSSGLVQMVTLLRVYSRLPSLLILCIFSCNSSNSHVISMLRTLKSTHKSVKSHTQQCQAEVGRSHCPARPSTLHLLLRSQHRSRITIHLPPKPSTQVHLTDPI